MLLKSRKKKDQHKSVYTVPSVFNKRKGKQTHISLAFAKNPSESLCKNWELTGRGEEPPLKAFTLQQTLSYFVLTITMDCFSVCLVFFLENTVYKSKQNSDFKMMRGKNLWPFVCWKFHKTIKNKTGAKLQNPRSQHPHCPRELESRGTGCDAADRVQHKPFRAQGTSGERGHTRDSQRQAENALNSLALRGLGSHPHPHSPKGWGVLLGEAEPLQREGNWRVKEKATGHPPVMPCSEPDGQQASLPTLSLACVRHGSMKDTWGSPPSEGAQRRQRDAEGSFTSRSLLQREERGHDICEARTGCRKKNERARN